MAASNIGTGLGIALGGRAKDFTQIELAQRRQAAMEEKAKAAAKDKKLEDITKDISVKPGEYLPFREQEIRRRVAQYIEDAQNPSGYADIQTAKWNLLSDLDKFRNEAKEANRYREMVAKGVVAVDDDIETLFTAPSSEEVITKSTRGGIISSPDGTFRVSGYDIIDLPMRQSQLAARVRNEFEQGKTMIGPDGKPMMIGEPTVQDFRNALAADFDQNDLVKRNAIRQYRTQLEKAGFQGEALINEARRMYVDNGINFLSGNTIRGAGGTDVNVRIGMGGEQNPATTPVSDNKIMIMGTNPATGEKFLGTYTRAKTWTLGDAFATIPPGVEAYYGDTGEPVSSADIEKATFNDLSVGYVLNRDITLSGPFGKVSFKKGQPILDEYFEIASQNNLIKPGIIAASKVGDRTIYSDGERFLQTKAITASKEDTPMINENIKEIRSFFDAFNREFESSKKRKAATPSGTPKKEWGGMPSSTQKPVSSQGAGGEKRFTSPSGEKAKSSLPKVNK